MKAINVRFQPSTMRSVPAHPGLTPGQDPNDDGRPVIEITEIPDEVSITAAIRLWDDTAYMTHIKSRLNPAGQQRYSFRYSELSPGRILFA